jgi:hypothetical protein
MFSARLAGGGIDGHAADRVADEGIRSRRGGVTGAAGTACLVPVMIVIRHGKMLRNSCRFSRSTQRWGFQQLEGQGPISPDR